MQESKPRYVEVVSWDDRRGDYLVYPTAVAQQSKSRLVTEEGDVYTWRRSGKYVLRYRVDSVYSPSIRKHDVEPFKEYWMFGSLRQPTGRN